MSDALDVPQASDPLAAEAPAEQPDDAAAPTAERPGASEAGRDNVVSHGGDARVENITNNYYRSMTALARYAADHGAVNRDMQGIVSPPDAEEHLLALRESRILVLTGAAHTGLPTAAAFRWSQFANSAGDLALDELHPDNREALQGAVDQCAARTVQLLDASRDTELSQDIVELLPRFRAALRGRDGYLVIALGEQFNAPGARALPGSVFALGRPDPRLVLAAHLDDGVDARPLLTDERFNAVLARCWPPRVKRLASILNETDVALDVDAFVDGIERRLENWTRRLEELVGGLEPDTRALLVSAAAMEGAPAGSVALAADRFMDAVGFEGSHRDMLGMRRLDERLEPLAEVFRRTADGSTAFTEDGYGEAVLHVLWSQFPSWREPMREWFDRLLRPSSYLDDDQTATLLLRLLELASDTGDAPLVLERAANLLAGGGSRLRQELATNLLLAAATDPTIGRQTRFQMLRWARERQRTSVAMQFTVLATCTSREYLLRFPDSAMHRLKHLARSGNENVRSGALTAMVETGATMPLRSMLWHLSEWAGADAADRLRGSVPGLAERLFAHEAVRSRLHRQPRELYDAHEFATRFWKRALVSMSPAEVRAVVAAWLTLASELRPPHGERAADLLTAAASHDILAIGQLAQSLTAAAPDPERTSLLVARLRAGLTRMEIPLS